MGKINENNILCVFSMPGVDKDSDIILWRDDEGDDKDTAGYIIITEAIPTGRKDETDGKNIYEASRLARLKVVENDGEYSVDYNLAIEDDPNSDKYKALNAKVIGILDACQAELFRDYLNRLEHN